jgi:hypothetical protein
MSAFAADPDEVGALTRPIYEAEAIGDLASRHAQLDAALEKLPELAPLNWMAGRIWRHPEWISVASFPIDPDAERDFRARRAAIQNTTQLAELARWCAGQGWEDRSDLCYAKILAEASAKPNERREAAKQLKLVQVQGKWVSAEQAKLAEQEAEREKQSLEIWAPRLGEWKKDIEGASRGRARTATEALRNLNDDGAILAAEQHLLSPSPLFAEELIAYLKRIDKPRSTLALTRFAIVSPLPEVRTAATNALRTRPLHEFVPLLLTALEGKAKTQYAIQAIGRASKADVRARLQVGRETPVGLVVSTVDRADKFLPMRKTSGNQPDVTRQQAQAQAAASLQYDALLVMMQASSHNLAADQYNARFVAVLTAVTNQNLAEPSQWWDWWQSYNELPQRSAWIDAAYFQSWASYPAVTTMSCFPKQVPVWTETGLRPIADILPGDRVLSQDVESGELAYRLVQQVTRRDQADLLKVALADCELVSSTGHPFWVNTRGWQMAKELRPGDVVHTFDGCTTLKGAVRLPAKETVYNLVVADSSTYFVGLAGVLVHDVTFRRPTRALVPGYTVK